MEKRKRTLEIISAANKRGDAIVPGELAEVHFPKESGLSLLAWKLLVRVIDEAGAKICDPGEHRMPIAALNWSHRDADFIEDTLRELQRTIVELRVNTSRGPAKKSGPILTDVTRDVDAETGELIWEFSKAFKIVVKNSHYWAAVGAQALLHMECKYSPPLYMLAALYAGRNHNSVEIPIQDLARRIGAFAQSFKKWQPLRDRALVPAVAEINHLTGIRLEWEPVKRGRKVVAVKLTAWRKDSDEAAHAADELKRSRVGRKARREGTTEELAQEQLAYRELAERSLRRAAEGWHNKESEDL